MALELALRRFRSGMAILMMLVIGAASFAVVMHRAALAAPVHAATADWLTPAPANPAAPCQKRFPPGTVNTCPLSGFSIAGILGGDAGSAIEPPTAAIRWRLSDSSLPVQVTGLGLYRPPRSHA